MKAQPKFTSISFSAAAAAVALASVLFIHSAKSDDPDYITMSAHFDHYVPGASIFTVWRQTGDSLAGNALVTAAAALVGVDPSLVQLSFEIAGRLEQKSAVDHTAILNLPNGYIYCRGQVRFQSQFGNHSESIARFPTAFHVATSVSQNRDGSQSSVEGDMSVIGVKNGAIRDAAVQAGHCAPVSAQGDLLAQFHNQKVWGYTDDTKL